MMSFPVDTGKIKTRANENLSARVYGQIKRLILSNEIMPGQKLHHQQLSERLGVSRTPVREALTRLVQEGYVSLVPNRGFTCKEIRMQEAEEHYELREALETFAVEKASEHLTFEPIDRRCHSILAVAPAYCQSQAGKKSHGGSQQAPGDSRPQTD